jgi:hypothetical protein
MFALVALVANTAAQVYGATQQARAARANRRASERAAQDVLQRAEFAVTQYETELAQLRGRQEVSGAAQGLDIEQGSMAAIAKDTEAIGARDIAQIRLNAEREAWGIRTQARINERAGVNAAWAQGVGAVAGAFASPTGQTLLTKPVDAWRSFVGKRQLDRIPSNRWMFNDNRA